MSGSAGEIATWGSRHQAVRCRPYGARDMEGDWSRPGAHATRPYDVAPTGLGIWRASTERSLQCGKSESRNDADDADDAGLHLFNTQTRRIELRNCGARKDEGERLITIRAEQPSRYLCATSAPPHNSIRSSELLRFCAGSGYSCATLKVKRRNGMAQMMGGAGPRSFFVLIWTALRSAGLAKSVSATCGRVRKAISPWPSLEGGGAISRGVGLSGFIGLHWRWVVPLMLTGKRASSNLQNELWPGSEGAACASRQEFRPPWRVPCGGGPGRLSRSIGRSVLLGRIRSRTRLGGSLILAVMLGAFQCALNGLICPVNALLENSG